MYNPEKKECKECNEHFKSVIRISDGYVMYGQVCHGGSPACIKRNNQDESRKGQTYDPITGEHKKTRGAWHGEHYRDEFYRTRIPVRLQEIDSDEDKINRLILYSILDSNDDIHAWFSKEIGHDHGKKGKDYYGTPVLYSGTIWEAITEMDTERVKRLIKEAMHNIVVESFTTGQRNEIAGYIGINVKKEFVPTEEYLKKKLKADLIELGEKYKVFKKKEVRAYMNKAGIKDLNVKNAKKDQLVSLFVKTGIDLTGVVPDEIVDAKCV
jgi:hypothetical protein